MPLLDERGPARTGRAAGLLLAATLCLVAAAALLATGCSSDDPSAVGAGLVGAEIDIVLQPLGLNEIERYTALTIEDEGVPHWEQEVLYLGEYIVGEETTASSILVEYDFDSLFDDEITADLFTSENIATVDLRLIMLRNYAVADSNAEVQSWATNYDVFALPASFDSTAFPGPAPSSVDLHDLNLDPSLDERQLVEIQLNVNDFLGWVDNGGRQAFLIEAGEDSKPGLVGYCSTNITVGHASSNLDDTHLESVLGPALLVKFLDPDLTIAIAPSSDVSTFHEVAAAPTTPDDGFFLRTCMRSYPGLLFDFGGLPENAIVNRAVLSVANDTTTATGALESIVISEMDVDFFGAPGDSVTLSELWSEVDPFFGWTSVEPTLHRRLEFDITNAVQRVVNGVYDGRRGFLLSASEDFAPNYDLLSTDPDFFFTQFNFYGLSHEEPLMRPHVEITYSVVETDAGGEE